MLQMAAFSGAAIALHNFPEGEGLDMTAID